MTPQKVIFMTAEQLAELLEQSQERAAEQAAQRAADIILRRLEEARAETASTDLSRAEEPAILRAGDVKKITGLSISTIYRLERAGSFPARIKLGPRTVGWARDEVISWVEQRQKLMADITREGSE